MDILKAECVVVTPMFLGAASRTGGNAPDCADGIRGASVKGALRAVFRALNWSRIRQMAATDDQALHLLHTEEAAIFGSAAKDNRGGQARFLLRVHEASATPQKEIAGKNSALDYLLGMGLYHFRDGMLRDHIPADTSFKLELALKPSLSKQQRQQLKDTLLFWGLMGGLGSRVRKGFGSVSLVSLHDSQGEIPLPSTVEEFKSCVRNLLGTDLVEGQAPFTAFTRATRMQISASGKNALDLLKRHADEMGMYRGYGRDHKTFKKPAEKNFQQDHDWAYDLSKGKADKNYLPKRAVFGLPHPYFLSGAGFKVEVEAATGRRASPLMAHIHRLPSGEHLLVHTVYRSQFLPESVEVQVNTKAQSYRLKQIDQKIDWDVLDTFLSRFKPTAGDVIHG